jgi:hypothetical protein
MTYTAVACLWYWLGICTTDPVIAKGVSLAECERVIKQFSESANKKPGFAYCRPERRPA